ncbi:MAG TPA: hypothetical protein VKH64_15175 [Candidatus Binatia bacterium]|nr:hypothetical protein [Candidatus Binatia bacterium]
MDRTTAAASVKAAARRRIPMSVKLAYSAFVAVLVPYYWTTYTPWNFLFFCDIALLLTFVGLWLESPLIVGAQAVGILLPQTLWIADFGVRLVSSHHITGMTDYMFDHRIPLFVRALSSFHGWLPFLLLWLLARFGYDRRSFGVEGVLIVTVLVVCYAFGPAPPAPASNPQAAVNVNYVYGFSDERPQTWLPEKLWLAAMIAGTIVSAGATHAALRKVFPEPGGGSL